MKSAIITNAFLLANPVHATYHELDLGYDASYPEEPTLIADDYAE